MWIGVGLPGGPASNFLKAEIGIQLDRARVVIADVKPDSGRVLFAGMLHGALRQDARNPTATVIGVGGNIRNEINTFAPVTERNKAGVADNLVIFIPHVARQRQRRG